MFTLNAKSLTELKGVHPDMVKIVKRAAEIAADPFIVFDGARTLEEQREFVRRKVSKTMRSRHLVQTDGYGHAVDLVPLVAGQARWDWGTPKRPGPIWTVAVVMAKASRDLGIDIIWGGVWDRKMSQYDARSVAAVLRAVEDYKKRHRGDDFLDGPHYQLAA